MQTVATVRFDPSTFVNTPIFAADDVAIYQESLPLGTTMPDVVASMAPPFDNFFIEFQGVPNKANLYAWGVFVLAHNYSEAYRRCKDDHDTPRWILEFQTFMEREKGKPFGPVSRHFIGLAEDGTWFRHSNGLHWSEGQSIQYKGSTPIPLELSSTLVDNVALLIFPALLTISFMHCKSVTVRDCVPPEKLSLSHEKKYGHKLTRYHVLDIQPLRKLLDQYRSGSPSDLRHALHICRGHFKTFTEDAPLLGRHTGTYWWAPQVRGAKEVGLVVKDYRVKAPAEFGTAYRDANEVPAVHERQVADTDDPDRIGLGLAAHNRTQNTIAEVVRTLGWNPRSPAANEPEYDLAWQTESGLFVCEVKSLSVANEERQMRMAIGQVIRYRQKLTAAGYEPVTAVIGIEKHPSDTSWEELCRDEDIVLIWPDTAEKILRTEFENRRSSESNDVVH
ncbi:MAG: hypothetical protein CAF45_004880 [Nitrospira sp. CG24E]|nr:MAG: hypothetical protein CAF45_004880 [Nitrospira sp. CG24E]